jgi:drug/metabolite transporter (DMT)-like permease
MLWFTLSILTALSVAARDVSIKTYDQLPPLEIAAIELFWSLPLLLLGCLWVPVPTLDQTFWWAFLLSIPINIIAYILYLYSIKMSPLSLTVPFLAFTPVFMILTGLFVLDEKINIWGGFGIGFIVLGSYILNFKENQDGLLKPFTALLNEKGSWMMLIVALVFSFAAVIGKKAMLHSSALYFSFYFFLVFNIVILIVLFITKHSSFKKVLQQPRKGPWLGSLLVIHISCHGLAIAISTAVYMIAIKRSSILFSVLMGWLILQEEDIKYRGLGTIFMFMGMLFISILG